ncbi:hypothetical protein L208DRAFT_1349052 [Tricholoma matsutake]|nr:hypothetical protein L208DRAFT_1349052 [Tricholoma matsutake 945]
MSNSSPNFPKLNNHNYASWKDQMAAWRCKQGWWRVVTGDIQEPSPGDAEAHRLWFQLVDKGAGDIYLHIEDDQKHHLGGVFDNPKKMWELLE